MTQKLILAGALIVALGAVALPRSAFAPFYVPLPPAESDLDDLVATLRDELRRFKLETETELNTQRRKLEELERRLNDKEHARPRGSSEARRRPKASGLPGDGAGRSQPMPWGWGAHPYRSSPDRGPYGPQTKRCPVRRCTASYEGDVTTAARKAIACGCNANPVLSSLNPRRSIIWATRASKAAAMIERIALV
jgi:hypothetical protein